MRRAAAALILAVTAACSSHPAASHASTGSDVGTGTSIWARFGQQLPVLLDEDLSEVSIATSRGDDARIVRAAALLRGDLQRLLAAPRIPDVALDRQWGQAQAWLPQAAAFYLAGARGHDQRAITQANRLLLRGSDGLHAVERVIGS